MGAGLGAMFGLFMASVSFHLTSTILPFPLFLETGGFSISCLFEIRFMSFLFLFLDSRLFKVNVGLLDEVLYLFLFGNWYGIVLCWIFGGLAFSGGGYVVFFLVSGEIGMDVF